MMSLNDIPSMYSGESKNLKITVYDKNGNTVNIAGSTFTWTLSMRNSTINKTSADGSITILDSANGLVQVALQPSDTQNISGVYKHLLEETDSNGNVSVVVDDLLNIKSR